MAFTEEIEEKCEVIPPWDIIQVRFADVVKKDGKEVGRTYRRHSLQPGDPVTSSEHNTTYGHTKNYSAKAEKLANALWDADHIAKYKAANPLPERS
tara:strand:+ start:486 stop:773 length:288 start_codon:yes stop_codon:yes gene_type:complete